MNQFNLNAKRHPKKMTPQEWIKSIIAILIVIGFFGMCISVQLTRMDTSDHDILNMLFGQLSAAFLAVVASYFGRPFLEDKK